MFSQVVRNFASHVFDLQTHLDPAVAWIEQDEDASFRYQSENLSDSDISSSGNRIPNSESHCEQQFTQLPDGVEIELRVLLQ